MLKMLKMYEDEKRMYNYDEIESIGDGRTHFKKLVYAIVRGTLNIFSVHLDKSVVWIQARTLYKMLVTTSQ
jgi:hypothetical protein